MRLGPKKRGQRVRSDLLREQSREKTIEGSVRECWLGFFEEVFFQKVLEMTVSLIYWVDFPCSLKSTFSYN